jgi:hypothetical protein
MMLILAPTQEDEGLVSWWLRMRQRMPKQRRKSFDSVVILVVRSLWLKRKDCIFSCSSPRVVEVVQFVIDQLLNLCLAGLVDRSLLASFHVIGPAPRSTGWL